MREQDGSVVPILDAETLGAIKYGNRLEPVTETYPAIAAAGVLVLLVYASSPTREEPVARFGTALPNAQVVAIPDAIHDLVSFAPGEVADVVGSFIADHR